MASRFEKILVLVGPTGVGKSEAACQLALKHQAEIVSADVFQVYKGMAIATAQPPLEWQQKVPHHFIGTRSPLDPWSAVEFAASAATLIERLKKEGKNILLVGGAGFYLKTLIEGAPASPPADDQVRSAIRQKAEQMGEEAAYEWLEEIDPAAAERLHPNDTQRILRALEVKHTTAQDKPAFSPLGGDQVVFVGLERSRENLDVLLKQRIEGMWTAGLVQEALDLQALGVNADHPAWKAIGYEEAIGVFNGSLSLENASERIFRRTRQYAKRQGTWFRHQHPVQWVDLEKVDSIEEALETIERLWQTP